MNPEDDGHGEDPIGETIVDSAIKNFAGGQGTVGQTGPDLQMARKEYASVLQAVLRGISETKDYMQILGVARWLSEDDWADWCAAFEECERYGVNWDFLVRRLVAQSAGVDGGKLNAILETISHTQITTNYMGKKQGFFNRNFGRNNGNNGQGPLPK